MLEINTFKEVIKERDSFGFSKLLSEIQILGNERVKLVGNNLRDILGREKEEIDIERCVESARTINAIAEKNGVDFKIPLDWENLEKFLRITLMDDIAEEFKKQV